MNLFLTVGTQLPFDRLTRAVDAWLDDHPEYRDHVFGQIGPVGTKSHLPRNFEWTEFLTPEDFGCRFDQATHVISHAGMGTIISAMVATKPITILARRAKLGEQRNDHQLTTVRNFQAKAGIQAAHAEDEVPYAIDRMLNAEPAFGLQRARPLADQSLTDAIRAEILA